MFESCKFSMTSVFVVIIITCSFSSSAASCGTTSCRGNANELFDNFYLSPSGNGRVFLHIRSTVNKDTLDCTLVENRFVCSGQQNPDTFLANSSAFAGGSPSLN